MIEVMKLLCGGVLQGMLAGLIKSTENPSTTLGALEMSTVASDESPGSRASK